MKNNFLQLVILTMKSIYYAFVLALFSACNLAKPTVADEIADRIGSKITFPDSLLVLNAGEQTQWKTTEFINSELPTLTFIVNAECGKCIEKLARTDAFIRSLEQEINVLVFLNMSNKESFIRNIYKDVTFSYPLIINQNNQYEKLNKLTTDKPYLHALLLNSKAEIMAVGDPTQSTELENLYRRQLQQKTAVTD